MGRPAARVGDKLVCVGPPDTIAQGEPTVLIGGKPAARLGDSTVHGGKIVAGEHTVLIGGNNSVTLPDWRLADPTRKKPDRPPPPQSMDECMERLRAARAKLEDGQAYKPAFTEDEMKDKIARGDVEERFMVTFQVKRGPDEKLVHVREPSKRAPIWGTTFSMLENADTDPRLLAGVLGTMYDPNREYALYVIDQGPDCKSNGSRRIVPTYENMRTMGVQEFGATMDKDILCEVMTPEYQAEYSATMQEFFKTIDPETSEPLNEFKSYEVDLFKKDKFAGAPVEKKRFEIRHTYRTELGANKDFLGTGMTMDTRPDRTQEVGVVEVLRLENNPPTIATLEACGAIRTAPCKII